MGLRFARLLGVVLLVCTACVDSYRTVGPMPKRPAFDDAGVFRPFEFDLTRIEFDGMLSSSHPGLTYAMLLRHPTVSNNTIVGIEPLYGKRWSMPLSRVIAVQTRERSFIDKLVSIHFGVAPVSVGGGLLRIEARR